MGVIKDQENIINPPKPLEGGKEDTPQPPRGG
jgi:hypothetical protein